LSLSCNDADEKQATQRPNKVLRGGEKEKAKPEGGNSTSSDKNRDLEAEFHG